MTSPKALILRAPGTNCDEETAVAFQRAGGEATIMHINRVIESPALLKDYQILCFPGGFSYGDDVAAGRILANQIRHQLRDPMLDFKNADKLVLGICNGFQVLIKSGMLLDDTADAPAATLTWNNSGRFEDRWVELKTGETSCVFLKDIDQIYLPMAHAEGKFAVRDAETLAALQSNGQCAVRYCNADGSTDDVPFPANPNGSIDNLAGICDPSGRVFGMMPHPERFLDATNHPQWTRQAELPESGQGLQIFTNAVNYFSL